MKTTPAFDRTVAPARAGVYERKVSGGRYWAWSYWDGTYWHTQCEVYDLASSRARSGFQVETGPSFKWRGLAEAP